MPAAGKARHSLRREKNSIYRGLKELQREVGDTVGWYEPDPADSSSNSVYDEGPGTGAGLVYRVSVPIPSVWIRLAPPAGVQTEGGEYLLRTCSLRISSAEIRRSGITHPISSEQHYNDRFAYNGFLFRVETYQPKGWLQGEFIMVDVMGRQYKGDELVTDHFPFWELDSAAHLPGNALSWPNTQPTDWETQ